MLAPFQDRVNETTVALAFLIVVLLVAAWWGSWPALAASLLGALSFNFFFLPPLYTLTIEDPRNWTALGAFVVTAVTAGQLSERARRRAAEGAAQREVARAASAYNRSLLEASLDALVAIGPDGAIDDVNEATTRVTGVPREGVVGTEFSSYFTEPEKARTGYELAFATGAVTDYPLTIRSASGGRLTDVLYNASVYKDAGGRVRGVFAAARDVTARNRAEGELRRINRAHRALSSCNQALIRATSETDWLEQVCRIVVGEAGYRFCWVGRAEHDDAKSVRPIAQAGFEEGYLDRAGIRWADDEHGRGPTGTCIREGRPIACTDIATDSRMAPWRAEALKRGYASSISIPLALDASAMGAMTIYASEPSAFGAEEVALLCELADDLAYGLATLRTRSERNKAQDDLRALNAQLEERVSARTAELRAAREREANTGGKIQRMLLLDEPPRDVRGLRVAALSLPSERISGDFYAFFRHDENDCLDVLVADVMGKGVGAGLLGAATKSHFPDAMWRLMAKSAQGSLPEPMDIVTLAHAHMAHQLIELESFVTACYARFDIAKRKLSLVDCGHTGALHFSAKTGTCMVLHGDNLALGVREGELFDQITVALDVGDVVVFFSDGVTEARNERDELFGSERLVECVTRNCRADPATLVTAVRGAAMSFAGSHVQADDLTCVVVQLVSDELPLARAELELRSPLVELSRLRIFVATFCTKELDPPLAEEAVSSLVLAADEAASNVMKHAYHGRQDQRIDVAVEAFRDRVALRLRYLGPPFDALAVPPPSFDGSRESGFGVFLIAKSVDSVRYYRDDLDRSCILLEKRRPA